MRSKPLLLLSLLLLTLISGGCTPAPLYTYTQSVEKGWGSKEELFYTLPITDTTRPYEVQVLVRYSPAYPYRTLPLGIVWEGPDRRYHTSTLQLPLRTSSSTYGYNIHLHEHLLDSARHFPTPGLYTLSLRQLSSDTLLLGVSEIGVTIR